MKARSAPFKSSASSRSSFGRLLIVVTGKYVLFLMQADNKGEGGTLSLVALAQNALGRRTHDRISARRRRSGPLFGRRDYHSGDFGSFRARGTEAGRRRPGALCAAGDDRHPCAAVRGPEPRHGQGRGFLQPDHDYVFRRQRRARPVAYRLRLDHFGGVEPNLPGLSLSTPMALIGFIVLGSVFLAVTGAEALYADMGHFGRRPIQAAWLFIVLPALVCNYLGQGALILTNPERGRRTPSILMAPAGRSCPLILLSTAATVIASQAVITGAFSLTSQAIQLGLLPRLEIVHTSSTQEGQIFIPRVNRMLLLGRPGAGAAVPLVRRLGQRVRHRGRRDDGRDDLACLLRRLEAMAMALWAALALTGAFLVHRRRLFHRQPLQGRGRRMGAAHARRDDVRPDVDLVARQRHFARADASELDPDARPDQDAREVEAGPGSRERRSFSPTIQTSAPSSLMHNLKHNKVLHERVVLLNVRTETTPRVPRRQSI